MYLIVLVPILIAAVALVALMLLVIGDAIFNGYGD